MTFSKDVKEELSFHLSSARHCNLAELAAILTCNGEMIYRKDRYYLRLMTENIVVARKYFTLIRKTFNINIDISVKTNNSVKKTRVYILIIRRRDLIDHILQAVKLTFDITIVKYLSELVGEDSSVSVEFGVPDSVVTLNSCCKRAFIRGAFIAAGSISNPKKGYHLEIVVSTQAKADQLLDLIQAFGIEAKTILRKGKNVVYIKEGSQIVDLLNVMEAHKALMELENVRILKEMRNSINRQVNCEAANINKTVNAAAKQIEDIQYIEKSIGLSDLADGLEDIARIRIEYPEASLKELGELLVPQIGKSGVNHRLRKLSLIAEQLRENKEDI